ncbi:hypothetical protein B0O95_10759 [Mycetohabitans endofungorum]|uniref:FAD dependent oxidoreductase n=1 Tax=Mycetohabitans endofungorum TaxID=417203 RepID=A0A2P5KA25_9BURK|nr:hypothetical protein B0O95_10759 [Mycetohabitans endofungorum]
MPGGMAPRAGGNRNYTAPRPPTATAIAAGGANVMSARLHARCAGLASARIHALTALIAYPECAPQSRSSTRRAGSRSRDSASTCGSPARRCCAAGAAQTQCRRRAALTEQAISLLGQAVHRWVPSTARICAALIWKDMVLLSPDGLPLVGATARPRVFVNCAHSPAAWALSHGSATVIADLVSGNRRLCRLRRWQRSRLGDSPASTIDGTARAPAHRRVSPSLLIEGLA